MGEGDHRRRRGEGEETRTRASLIGSWRCSVPPSVPLPRLLHPAARDLNNSTLAYATETSRRKGGAKGGRKRENARRPTSRRLLIGASRRPRARCAHRKRKSLCSFLCRLDCAPPVPCPPVCLANPFPFHLLSSSRSRHVIPLCSFLDSATFFPRVSSWLGLSFPVLYMSLFLF